MEQNDVFIAYHGTYESNGSEKMAKKIYNILSNKVKCYFYPVSNADGRFGDTPQAARHSKLFLLVANSHISNLSNDGEIQNSGLYQEIDAFYQYNVFINNKCGNARVYAYDGLTAERANQFHHMFASSAHFVEGTGNPIAQLLKWVISSLQLSDDIFDIEMFEHEKEKTCCTDEKKAIDIFSLDKSIEKKKEELLQLQNALDIIDTYSSLRNNLTRQDLMINDTIEMIREKSMHILEGRWVLHGEFSMFQGDKKNAYNSTGRLVLTWNNSKKCYDALYCYSVYNVYSREPKVTAICEGNSSDDYNGLNDNIISINFDILARTNQKKKQPNYKSHFTMNIEICNFERSKITKMISHFDTPKTKGIIEFNR
ncbi:MAG: hypothetical protein ACI4IK_01865 [Eubacterium sp.]